MAWFEYEGVTSGGTAIHGQLEAADHEKAMGELARMKIDLRDLRPAAAPPKRAAGLSESDFIFFNEQLASLAQAGIALDEGLAQLARDVESRRLRGWIGEIVADLRRGVPIDQAIAARERGLPLLYSGVIRAGIESGELPATLLNLNQHLRLIGKTRRLIWEAASYPLVVATLALGVMSLFLAFVVPQFREIFKDFHAQLPGPTVVMLSLSDHLWQILLGLGGGVILVILLWQSLRFSNAGRSIREEIVLNIPFVGGVHEASLIARFLRSVATALGTGTPLPSALRLAAGATGSPALILDADRLASEAERGASIFAANRSARIIPPLFGFCVQSAVGRDALPAAVAQLAVSYENRAVYTQSILRTFVFPLGILIVGCFMLAGIVAMFLPLIHLINAVSSG